MSHSGSSSSEGRHAQANQTPRQTPRTPRTPSSAPRRDTGSFAQSRAQRVGNESDTGEHDSFTRRETSGKMGKRATAKDLMTASRLQEIAKSFEEKVAAESAKLGAGDKSLSVRLGELFLEKKIKTHELVAKCTRFALYRTYESAKRPYTPSPFFAGAKRGEEDISKMEFRQHIRALLAKTDAKEIDALFDFLDEECGSTIEAENYWAHPFLARFPADASALHVCSLAAEAARWMFKK